MMRVFGRMGACTLLLFVNVLTALTSPSAAVADKQHVLNGDFAAWNEPPTLPVSWSNEGGAVVGRAADQTGEGYAIHLANPGSSLSAAVSQALPAEIEGPLTFSVDFAFEATPTDADRSFNMTLRDGGTVRINIRVNAEGSLQLFDRNSGLQGGGGTATWQTVAAGLQPSDFGAGLVKWYRLQIAANLATDRMSATLTDLESNAAMVTDVNADSMWDVPASGAPGAGIGNILLAIGRSQAGYRADNVSLTTPIPLTANAGADLNVTLGTGTAVLRGSVLDDGLPDPPGAVQSRWSVASQPEGGHATFADPFDPMTSVTFDALGAYELRLTACDNGAPDTCLGSLAVDTMTLTVVDSLPHYTIGLEEVPGPTMSVNNSAAWWSPIAVDTAGAVYVAYLATNSPTDDVIVAKRTPLGQWSWADTGVDARYDSGHTQASIAVDGDGYIHVFYDMHNHPMTSIRSLEPHSIEAGFVSQRDAFPTDGRYTYPNLATAENGDLYLIIRDRQTAHLDRTGWFFRYDRQNRIWLDLGSFAGEANTTIYPDEVFSPGDGTLRLIWEWAAGGAQASRHLGSYLCYDLATGQFSRMDGTPYATADMPVSVAAADIYQPLEGAEQFESGEHGIQSAKMGVDSQGRPVIAYSYSTTGESDGYEHRLATWDGQVWRRETISQGGMTSEKPWISVHNDTIHYYTQAAPGRADLYLRTTAVPGQSWSPDILVAGDLRVYRPMGVNHGGVDFLYLPSQGKARMYFARVAEGTVVAPDFDWDGDVDQADFGVFQVCYTGEYAPYEGGCGLADFDGNGHVDSADFERLRKCLSGPGIEVPDGCESDGG